MIFDPPLLPATLERRYKRFLADMRLPNTAETITAHCANPGSMMGLAEPGTRTWLAPSTNPARKLPYSWELAEIDGAFIGINTGRANRLVEEALMAGTIPELAGFRSLRREVPYGDRSRVDFLLEGADEAAVRTHTYVEVKSVTLMRTPGRLEFPDAVTSRGARHLGDLATMRAAGHRAVLLFLVQHTAARSVSIAADIDPKYAAAFVEARKQGVEVLCYTCKIDPQQIRLDSKVPFADDA